MSTTLDTTSLRTRLQQLIQERDLSIRAIATELAVDSGSLSRWLADKATATEQTRIDDAVAQWLDGAPKLGAFVETRAARRVLDALAFAKAYGDIACVYGSPGVGKTRTIKHFAERYPNVWTMTASPSTSTVVPALEDIAEAVGATEASSGARRLARAIRRRVRGLEGLLIIDEAQHLRPAALEEVRALHDDTNVGLALVGNNQVYSRLSGGREAAFAQLYSRIGMKVHLDAPTLDDVKRLCKSKHVTDNEVVKLLHFVAVQPGGLRLVVKALGMLDAAKAVTVDTVRAACTSLGIEVA